MNLIPGDVGRPVSHIVSNLVGYDQLVVDTQAVLDTLVSKMVEVQTLDGKWYSLRIQPYRTLDNVIAGAVITFVDITNAKEAREELRLNEERLRVALQTIPISIFNQNRELRYTWISGSSPFFSTEQVLDKTDAELLPAEEAEVLSAIKLQVLESGTGTRHEVRSSSEGKPRWYDITIEPVHNSSGDTIGVTCAMTDAHDRN